MRRKRGYRQFAGRRARLFAFVLAAILTGSALGYGLGVLNNPGPEPRTALREAPQTEKRVKPVAESKPVPSKPIRRVNPVPVPEEGSPRPVRPSAPATAPREAELAWVKNAVPSGGAGDKPAIAIVIDDVGLNPVQTRKAVGLPAPVTLAFLTYAERLSEQTAAARAAGHELLVHFPMEPVDPKVDPGPNALLASLSEAELRRRLHWGLARFDGYVGVNNHMGSQFTTAERPMALVLRDLKSRGLLFLDSATSASSVGARLSREIGLPHAVRDVFLDNSKDRSEIRASLVRLEERARSHGRAVGIGHPFDETIEEIAAWMDGARGRGFALVPLTAIVRSNAAPARQLGSREQGPAG